MQVAPTTSLQCGSIEVRDSIIVSFTTTNKINDNKIVAWKIITAVCVRVRVPVRVPVRD